MISVAQVLGVCVVLYGTASFLLNIFLMFLFASKRLISSSHENHAIYRLIFNFLVSDTIQVTPTIYIGLCAVLQKTLLPEELEIIPGTINLWLWYQTELMLIIMAVNRYVGICHFHKYARIFTARTAAILIVITWLVSGAYTITNQFLIPCCALVPYYPIFTFTFNNPNGQENLMVKYQPPLNQITTGILFICYSLILWKVHKSGREVMSTMTLAVQRNRARQNIRFAIQFVFISLFFVLMYVFYNVFPKLLPSGVLYPYSAIAFCMVTHCTINSFMYLTFNPEVRGLAKQMLCCWKSSATRSNTQNFQRTQITNRTQLQRTTTVRSDAPM